VKKERITMEQQNIKILPPVHTSPDTAFIIKDYPTGRRARCAKRVWIETKPGHGQRLVYQTSQPKHKMQQRGWKEGDSIPANWWRDTKASTYGDIIVMYLEANTGHQKHTGFNYYHDAEPEKWEKILAEWGEGMSEGAKAAVKTFINTARTRAQIKTQREAVGLA
jgi:hypothetical protein